jgi:diguanylate cyclase (GGDEF)-like protein
MKLGEDADVSGISDRLIWGARTNMKATEQASNPPKTSQDRVLEGVSTLRPAKAILASAGLVMLLCGVFLLSGESLRGSPISLASMAFFALAALSLLTAFLIRAKACPMTNDCASLRRVMQTSSNPTAICTADGKAVWANPAFITYLGLEGESDIPFPLASRLGAAFASLSQGGESLPQSATIHLQATASAPERYAHSCIQPLELPNGKGKGFLLFLTDSTDETKLRLGMRREANLLNETTRIAKIGGWELCLTVGDLYLTEGVWKILDLSPQKRMSLEDLLLFASPTHRPQFRQCLDACAKSGTPFELDVALSSAKGREKWVKVEAHRETDPAGGQRLVGAMQDVTSRHRQDEDLKMMAETDSLTGLWKRPKVTSALTRIFAEPWSSSQPTSALILLDLDRFKTINDSLGHQAGDFILKEAARRITNVLAECRCTHSLGRAPLAARFGGDEFLVLLEAVRTPQDALETGQRVLESLQRPFHLPQGDVFTSGSAGISVRGPASESAQDLLRDADTALYASKAAGRCKALLCTETMKDRASHRIQLEMDLRRAIDRRELHLVYQPIMNLATGAVLGFEALTRWRHPERGLVPPTEFIPIAAESGLILPLGAWVLSEATQQAMRWREEMPHRPITHFGVNVDRAQLFDSKFIESLLDIARRCPHSAQCLHIEITEDGVLQDPGEAARVLNELRQAGVSVDLDDFGTGRSSLSCLQDLPIDVLKLDRSFVRAQAEHPAGRRVVSAILDLSRAFDLKVVAEGIETPSQLRFLQDLNCPMGQGYLFSPPLPASQAGAILADPTLVQGCWNEGTQMAA